ALPRKGHSAVRTIRCGGAHGAAFFGWQIPCLWTAPIARRQTRVNALMAHPTSAMLYLRSNLGLETGMSKKLLTGSFVALITPFNRGGSVDFAAFRTLLA